MTPKKWDFELEGYSGMHYYCIANTFEEARKKADALRKEEELEESPDVVSISADGGDYVG